MTLLHTHQIQRGRQESKRCGVHNCSLQRPCKTISAKHDNEIESYLHTKRCGWLSGMRRRKEVHTLDPRYGAMLLMISNVLQATE